RALRGVFAADHGGALDDFAADLLRVFGRDLEVDAGRNPLAEVVVEVADRRSDADLKATAGERDGHRRVFLWNLALPEAWDVLLIGRQRSGDELPDGQDGRRQLWVERVDAGLTAHIAHLRGVCASTIGRVVLQPCNRDRTFV